MKERIIISAENLKEETVRLRRDFHKHPETGFCEFRTASIIVHYLKELGYDLMFGDDVVNAVNEYKEQLESNNILW